MTKVRTLLLIDDDPAHAEVFREALIDVSDGPYAGEWVTTLPDGCQRLRKKGIWAVFLNLHLHGSEGLCAFDQLLEAAPGIPTLVLGGAEDKTIALQALKRGAKDYLIEGHIDCYSLSRAIHNMGERETAEEALFAEKARARITLDSIGDAVLSTDILGNVTYLNVVAEKMTGWSREAASGRPLAEVFRIIDGITRNPAPNPMESAIAKNKTVALIFSFDAMGLNLP